LFPVYFKFIRFKLKELNKKARHRFSKIKSKPYFAKQQRFCTLRNKFFEEKKSYEN